MRYGVVKEWPGISVEGIRVGEVGIEVYQEAADELGYSH
jgi:hypothetical protein